MSIRKSVLIIGLLALSACSMADHYTPVVDVTSKNADQYPQALAACKAKAAEVDVIEDSLTGAGMGGLFGAAMGAGLGAIGGTAGRGAMVGSVLGGGISGGTIWSAAQARQVQIMNNCLRARGFNVLG